jgi:hypothetical protein
MMLIQLLERECIRNDLVAITPSNPHALILKSFILDLLSTVVLSRMVTVNELISSKLILFQCIFLGHIGVPMEGFQVGIRQEDTPRQAVTSSSLPAGATPTALDSTFHHPTRAFVSLS